MDAAKVTKPTTNPDPRYKHFAAWDRSTPQTAAVERGLVVGCTGAPLEARRAWRLPEWVTHVTELVTCPTCMEVAQAEEVLEHIQKGHR